MTEEVKNAAVVEEPKKFPDGRVAEFKQADADEEEHGEPLKKAPAKAAEEEPAKVEEEAVVEDDKNEDGSWKEGWIKTHNADADAAIELMEKAGVKPVEGNEIFKDAIESGDMTKVRWDLLEARLGASQARLVRNGIEAYYNNELGEQIKIRDEAFTKVGGEANWKKIQSWAAAKEGKDTAFKGELHGWRNALKIGGFAARAAVEAITSAYEADPKNSGINNAAPVRGKAAPNDTGAVGEPLGRAAYFEAVEKAGGDRAPESVRKALWARREAGRSQGI